MINWLIVYILTFRFTVISLLLNFESKVILNFGISMVFIMVRWKWPSWRIYGVCNLLLILNPPRNAKLEKNTSSCNCLFFYFISVLTINFSSYVCVKSIAKLMEYQGFSGAWVTNLGGTVLFSWSVPDTFVYFYLILNFPRTWYGQDNMRCVKP